MKKKKKTKKKGKGEFSNSKLFDLILLVFKENPNKKLNYKQVSKILKVSEMGVKIQIIDVIKEMVISGILTEEQRGSYRLLEKTSTLYYKYKKHK